jgi:DNA adenine methylase
MDTYTGKKRTILYLLMVYCSFTGSIILNGKWRTSSINGNLYSKNQCHVFTGDYKEKIRKLNELLRNIKIYNKDYTTILKEAKQGDFVFLDPPYIEDKVYAFNYNKIDNFDINVLKIQVDILSKNKVKWMMTQIDTIQVRNIFQKYKFYEYFNNSNFLNGKNIKKELIIKNY